MTEHFTFSRMYQGYTSHASCITEYCTHILQHITTRVGWVMTFEAIKRGKEGKKKVQKGKKAERERMHKKQEKNSHQK